MQTQARSNTLGRGEKVFSVILALENAVLLMIRQVFLKERGLEEPCNDLDNSTPAKDGLVCRLGDVLELEKTIALQTLPSDNAEETSQDCIWKPTRNPLSSDELLYEIFSEGLLVSDWSFLSRKNKSAHEHFHRLAQLLIIIENVGVEIAVARCIHRGQVGCE